MELAMIILAIGVAFMLNSGNISKDRLKRIAKSIDVELSKEFEKRDKKIQELEERIRKIDNIS